MIDKSNLLKRHKSEISFHDKKAKKDESKKSFYNQGAILRKYIRLMGIVGNLDKIRLLDLGCGNGWSSIGYATKGADVIGFDISHGALSKAKELCVQKKLENRINFVQGCGEYLPFKKAFDVVIGIAILHHLDLQEALESLNLVLKDNGKATFMEPLAHNPFVNLYRKLTPNRRTEDEKPLDIDFIYSLKSTFRGVTVYGYDLFSLISFVFIPFKAYNMFRICNDFLSKVDQFIFRLFPKMEKYCWGAIIVLQK